MTISFAEKAEVASGNLPVREAKEKPWARPRHCPPTNSFVMSAAATCFCAAVAFTFHTRLPHGHSASITVSRAATSAIAMRDLLDKPEASAKQYAWLKSSSSEVDWITSPSGYKFIEEKIGQGPLPARGDVVQIHYTVSLLSSGVCLRAAA